MGRHSKPYKAKHSAGRFFSNTPTTRKVRKSPRGLTGYLPKHGGGESGYGHIFGGR